MPSASLETEFRHELVLVDSSVPDYQVLVQEILANSPGDRRLSVITLGSEQSGWRPVGQLDAVHIVSHARAGALYLGGTEITGATAANLAALFDHLAIDLRAGGDLLFYGCDLAAGPGGREFLQAIHEMTGADVAASTDLTGAAALGGDWDLEYMAGAIDTATLLPAPGSGQWTHVLAFRPVTGDIRLNESTNHVQQNVDVAIRSDGSFVAVWDSPSPSAQGIYARLFNQDGTAITGDFLVSTLTTDVVSDPAVGIAPDGRFVVTWLSSGTGTAIQARVFDAASTPLTGVITVDTSVGILSNPTIGVGADDTFIVAWDFKPDVLGPEDVFLRRYSIDGSPLGTAFLAHDPSDRSESQPAIAIAPSGNFVVTWTGSTEAKPAIMARLFDEAGVGGATFQVAENPIANAKRSTVAMDASGNFVVAWDEKEFDGSKTAVRMRRFTALGAGIGGDIQVNTTTDKKQDSPDMAMDGSGDFVVTWTSAEQDGDGPGVIARAYQADGTPVTGEFIVNQYVDHGQSASQVAFNNHGNLVFAWHGAGKGDADGVFGRLYEWTEAADAPPMIQLQDGSLTYTENDPPVLIDPALTVTDPDSPNLIRAVVSISAGFVPGEDRLSYDEGVAGPLGIVGAYDPQTGILTLSGVASVSSYQLVLRSVSYWNSSDDPASAPRTVTFTVDDGGWTASDGRAINVVPVNDAPVAADDTFTTTEGVPLTVLAPGVLGNDNDPDDELLTASLVGLPSNGAVVLNPDGSFVYTPAPLFIGTDSFTYRVADASLAFSDLATVSITVSPLGNQAPIAAADEYSTHEDSTLVIAAAGVLANDVDPEGDTLAAVLVSGPTHGVLRLDSDGGFTYTPEPNWSGTDSFTYYATDGGRNSDPVSVTITVTEVNDAPTLDPIPDRTLPEDSEADTVILTGITAGGGETQTLSVYAVSSDGSLIPDPMVTYTSPDTTAHIILQPVANAHGTARITVTVSDGVTTTSRTFTVTVTPVNDAPVTSDDSVTINEDESAVIDVLENDGDIDGDSLVISSVTQGSNGRVTTDGSTVTYTPEPNWHGTDTFTYTVSDGAGGMSTATVTVTVVPVNDAPAAVNDEYTLDQNSELRIPAPGVLANDTDVEPGLLTASLVSLPSYGSLDFAADGSFTYRPNPTFHGTDSFTYRVTDAAGLSDLAVATLHVIAPSGEPIAHQDDYLVAEDETLEVPADGVLANDTPPGYLTLTAELVRGPRHGRLTFRGDGSFTYIPHINFYGNDTFLYRAVDTNRGVSDTTEVMIAVTPVADPPTARGERYVTSAGTTLTVGTGGLLINDVDPDGDPLSVQVITGPASGQLIWSPDGSFSLTTAAGFTGGLSFQYVVSDGTFSSSPVDATIQILASPVSPNPMRDTPALTDPTDSLITPPSQTTSFETVRLDVNRNAGDSSLPGIAATAPPPVDSIAGAPQPWVATVGNLAVGDAGPLGGEVPAPAFVPPVPHPPVTLPPLPMVPAPPESESAPSPAAQPILVPPPQVEAFPETKPALAPATEEKLIRGLNELDKQVQATGAGRAVAEVAVASGFVASAGFALLSPKLTLWLLGALAARRTVWKPFDPLDVVYTWEREKGGEEDSDEESLAPMFGK